MCVDEEGAVGFEGEGPFEAFDLSVEDVGGDLAGALAVAGGVIFGGEVEGDEGCVEAVFAGELENLGAKGEAEGGGVPDDGAASAEGDAEAVAGELEDLSVGGLVFGVAGEFEAKVIKGDDVVVGEVLGDPEGFAGAGGSAGEGNGAEALFAAFEGAGDGFFGGEDGAGEEVAEAVGEGVFEVVVGGRFEEEGDGFGPGEGPVGVGGREGGGEEVLGFALHAKQFNNIELMLFIFAESALHIGAGEEVEEGEGGGESEGGEGAGGGIFEDEFFGVVVGADEGEDVEEGGVREVEVEEAASEPVAADVGVVGGDDAGLVVDGAFAGGEGFGDIVEEGGEEKGEAVGGR